MVSILMKLNFICSKRYHKLVNEKCTFGLSDEEYLKESTTCNHPHYYEARVGYCRELLEIMKEQYKFSEPSGIRGFKNSCGHITFSDGQHRSCIAKKNNVSQLMFDYLGDNGAHLCRACYFKMEEEKKE